MATKPQSNPEPLSLPVGVMPWHNASWEQFASNLAAGRLPHAVLLGGPRGTGKRQFANQAAALLLCASPVQPASAEAAACGTCKQCRLLAADSHPDLTALAPVDSRVIKIDQVRRLTEFVVQSPQVSQRKVAIVDSADSLNINAANALLKTLEEPVEDVVLLLVHHAGEPLLPTIRSRCQALRLPLPGPEVALAWMQGLAPDQDRELLATALERARGAPLAALMLLQAGELEAGDRCLDSLRLYLKGERHLVDAAAPFVQLGLEPSLDLMSQWTLVAMKMALGESEAMTGPGRDMLSFLARSNQALQFTGILDQITAARRNQVYNINPELVIDELLLSWKALMPRRRRAAG